jgi:PAS domain S-box-containing protein
MSANRSRFLAGATGEEPGSGFELMPYVVAVLSTLAVLVLRLMLTPWFGDRPVLLWFVAPMLITAYVGGMVAGLFCTLLVAASTAWLLIPQLRGFSFGRPVDLIQWLSLLLIGATLSLMTGRMKRLLRSVRETDDLFAKAFRMSPDCMMILRISDRTVVRANDALCRLWGRVPAEVIGRPTREVSAWPTEEARVNFMAELEAKGEIFDRETHQRLADGRLLPVELSARILTFGGERCILCVMHDLTERRQAEATVHQIAAIVESSDDAIIGKNLDSVITSWNSGAEKIFGFTAAEMVGASILRIIPTDRQEEEGQILTQIIGGGVVRHFETVRLRKDGQSVTISVTVSPIKDASGRVVGASKIARDITARKQTERALLESEARFATAFRASPAALVISRRRDLVNIEVNDTFLQLFGCKPEEILGTTLAAAGIVDLAILQELHAELAANRLVPNRETTVRQRDGRPMAVILSTKTIELAGEACALTTLIDITDRKRAEEKLRWQEALLRETGQIAQVGGWTMEIPGGEGYWTEEVARIHDLDPATPISMGQGLDYYCAGSRPLIEAALRQALASGTPYDLELEITSAKGVHKWIRTIGHPVMEQGRVVRLRGSFQDISGRKQAEAALKASEERYRALFEHAPDGIVIADPQSVYLDANDSMCRMLGYTKQEFIGMHAANILAPAELARVEPTLRSIKAEGRHHEVWAFQRKDGSVFQAEVMVKILPDGNLLGMIRDITERIEAERVLREREAQLHATDRRLAEILQGMTEACFALNTEWRFTFVNDRGESLLRYRREEMLGRSIWEVFPQLAGTPMEANYHRAMKQRQPQAFEVFSPVAQRWLDIRLFPTPEGLAAFLMDISARKAAEQVLQKSQTEFEDLFENAPIGYHEVDLEGRLVRVNRTELKMLGYTAAEMLGRQVWTLLEDPEVSREATLAKLAGEERPIQFERRFRCKDGTILPLFVQDRVLRDEHGSIRGSRAALQDITELKRVEEEIRQLNATLEHRVAERTAELSDLYNNAPCGYHSLDKDGLIVRMNDTELNWLGFTREEVVGQCRITRLFTPASVAIFQENFARCKARGLLENMELEMVRRDGSILPVLLSATVVRDASGQFFMTRSTLVDYTDRRLAEQKLRQSQVWLEAANQELEAFTYSVSHDLRTPLRAVDGFSQAVLEDFGSLLPPEGQRYLHTIRGSAQHMGELIDDLLAFSRLGRQSLHLQPVEMEKLVRSALADLQSQQAGRRVDIRLGTLRPCNGDPALLKQVWLNLLANALKYSRRRDEACIEIGCHEEAGETVYSVRDNGTGFDMKYAHKLFGVFQRLHRAEDYEGTGVGLAIVQRVVHRHGGRVWAVGAPDQGATFSFTLNPPSTP